MTLADRLKRLLLGRALRTGEGGGNLGRIRALSTLASDALSSNVYATQEILIVLAAGGASLYRYGPAIAAAVVLVFAVVVAGYRHTVRQYPGGGADYEVAARNLGPGAAVVVAAAMLVDFALTLAVSVTATLDTLVSVAPGTFKLQVGIAVLLLLLMTVLSLRSGTLVASLLHFGTYAFVAAVLIMAAVAGLEVMSGETPRAPSADWDIATTGGGLAGAALVVVLARAFSSGSIAVTGVEAIGTGVPQFRKPRGANAAVTLVVLGLLSMLLFAAVTWLALLTQVHVTADSADLLGKPAGEQQLVIIQIAEAVFDWPIAVDLVAAATILILLAAGLSAFRSFTALSSILSRDGFLPRQLRAQGDRLVYSNGIVLLAVAAGALIWLFDASLTALIQLYVVGVFLALAVGQIGMVRHWRRELARPLEPALRTAARRGLAVATLASAVTSVVLVVVLVSKLTTGAWLVVILVPLLAMGMRGVHRHYETVAREMAAEEGAPAQTHHVIALILVARIHKPTMRAVAFARATRPSLLEAVTVAVDDRETERLQQEWADMGMPVPLTVLPSPFREINSPVIAYVTRLRAQWPDSLLAIYLPEYVVEHWWDRLLHNQSAARLKRRLTALQNVVVISVPYQMRSAALADAGHGARPPAAGITGLTAELPRIDPAHPPVPGEPAAPSAGPRPQP